METLCNLWQDIKDGMMGCSQPPIAVKPQCFSLALPAVASSSPNPFHLVVLSNFTQSSRSLSWKRGIWPPSPANYSLFLPPSSSSDHRSTALWPALAQNYEGYFQHCNLRNTWYTQRHTLTYRITHSAYTTTLGMGRRRQPRRLRVPTEAHVLPYIKHLCSSHQDRVTELKLRSGRRGTGKQGGGLTAEM